MPRYVSEITGRAEALLGKKFTDTRAGAAAFTLTQGFQWIKDAYDQISDYMRIPKAHVQISAVSGQRRYPVPNDCFDGFNGLHIVLFANVPLGKISLDEAVDRFGHGIDYTDPVTNTLTWFNPTAINGVCYYLNEFDDGSFSVIGTPASTDLSNVFDLYYVQSVPQPTTVDDVVPLAFEASIGHIALYVVGRALETDKSGRGAAILEEWEARLLKRKARAARQGRIRLGEAYTQDMKTYEYNYKGRIGGSLR